MRLETIDKINYQYFGKANAEKDKSVRIFREQQRYWLVRQAWSPSRLGEPGDKWADGARLSLRRDVRIRKKAKKPLPLLNVSLSVIHQSLFELILCSGSVYLRTQFCLTNPFMSSRWDHVTACASATTAQTRTRLHVGSFASACDI